MTKLKIVVTLFALLALIACSSTVPTAQSTGAADLGSLTPVVSITVASLTAKPISPATPSLTFTPTPIIRILPYAAKQAVLEYTYSRAALGGPAEFFDVFFGGRPPRKTTRLVMYSDGQLILQRSSASLLTKTIPQAEIDHLLYELDKRGFNSIETNQRHDDTDHLYAFGGRYLEVGVTDGAYFCLLVTIGNSKEICYYEPYVDFLTPKAKRLFQFLANYGANDTMLYEPDRILLFISQGQDLYNSFVEQPMPRLNWPADLPSLDTPKEKYIYLEGKRAEEFFSLVGKSTKPMIFGENGKDYSVLFTIVLPHESILQP